MAEIDDWIVPDGGSAAPPAAGGGVDDWAVPGAAAAQPAAADPWAKPLERGIRGIPSEIARTASENWHTIKEGFGFGDKRPGEKTGFLEGPIDTAKALLAVPQLVLSPLTGAVKSVGGHGLAAVEHRIGQEVNPEAAAKDDPEAMYRQAATDVEFGMGMAAPRGVSLPRVPPKGALGLPEAPPVPGGVGPVADTVRPAAAPAPAPVTPEGPLVATPRENLGIRLLPPDTPHVLPPPAEGLAGRRSAGAAGAEGTGPLAEVSPATLQKLKDIVREEGFTTHTLEQRLEEMSPHEFLGELSPNMRLHMSALQGAPGAARNEIVTTVQQRAREAGERMTASFDRAFGANENRAQLQRIMQIERDKEVEPFWNRFRNTAVPPSPDLNALMPRLEAAGALQAANKALRIEGLPTENGFLRLGAGEGGDFLYLDPRITTGSQDVSRTTQMPTASAFQYAKEHLDDLIERAAAAPGGENEVRRFTALKNALVGAIDNHPDARVSGIWREARDAYATPTSVMKAMKLGERALTGNIHADELPFITASYSPAELRAFNIGLRGRLEDIAGRPGKQESTLINTILAKSNQDKIRWAIGDQKAGELIAAIEHEQRMHHAPNQLIYNSMTQPRMEASKVWTPQAGMLEDVKLSDITHPVKTALKMGAKLGLTKRAERQAEAFSAMRDEAARVFTLQGPERDAVIRELVRSLEEPPRAVGGRVKRAAGGAVDEDAISAELARRAAAERMQNATTRRFNRASGGRVDPKSIDANPTAAQKKAGNYAKDHVAVHGLDVTIENAKGTFRGGVDRGGKPWKVRMPAHYGYIKGTVGKDKDHVDVYLGPHLKSNRVFVIDQLDAETGQFDEHKTFIGFPSKLLAAKCYHAAFSDGRAGDRLGGMHEMSIGAFKHWLEQGDTTKPILAEAETKKLTHAAVGYVAQSKVRGENCGRCSMFIPDKLGGPACTLVKSPIAAPAWCRRFDRKDS